MSPSPIQCRLECFERAYVSCDVLTGSIGRHDPQVAAEVLEFRPAVVLAQAVQPLILGQSLPSDMALSDGGAGRTHVRPLEKST